MANFETTQFMDGPLHIAIAPSKFLDLPPFLPGLSGYCQAQVDGLITGFHPGGRLCLAVYLNLTKTPNKWRFSVIYHRFSETPSKQLKYTHNEKQKEKCTIDNLEEKHQLVKLLSLLKFSFSEKATKSKCPNREEDCANQWWPSQKKLNFSKDRSFTN